MIRLFPNDDALNKLCNHLVKVARPGFFTGSIFLLLYTCLLCQSSIGHRVFYGVEP